MRGRYTLSGVMMFQGFLTAFMAPAMTLVSAGQVIQEMRTQTERVEDAMEYRIGEETFLSLEGKKDTAQKLDELLSDAG